MLQRILTFLLLAIATSVAAQNGTIRGTVTDQTGQTLVGASVVVEGTALGEATDIDGNFAIKNVKPGAYTLIVSFITYKTDTLKSITVQAGKETVINSKLEEESKQLTEVIITGQADRSSESILLKDRKNSIEMVQNIGAQELSRKGVSDAEGAVVQIAGVSKQEGVKNVFVRGLGDRYNSTSMNGLPLPSEDPEYKNITLDFFSSNIINNINVNKTFNPSIYGDVAGANIDIISKKLNDERELSISVSGGVNSQTAGKEFFAADGSNFLGNIDKSIPIKTLQQYSFKNSFQPNRVNSPILNSSFSLNAGRRFSIGNNAIKTFFVAGLSNDYNFRQGAVRQVTPTGGVRQDFKYDKYIYSVSNLALGNVTYEFGNENSISYNGLYVHDNKQAVGNYRGFSVSANDDITDPDAYNSFLRRQQVNDNKLFVNQIVSSFKVIPKLTVDAKAAYTTITGNEPDRRTNFYVADNENYLTNSSSPAHNHRFYSSLSEKDLAASFQANYTINSERNNKVTLGYNYRNTNRDFETVQFNFDWNTAQTVQLDNPDALFNQTSLNNGVFVMETGRGTNSSALVPFFYGGDRQIHAGNVNWSIDVNPSLTISVGSRFEKLLQSVEWDTNLDERNPNIKNDNTVKRDPFYILPSLNIKYNFSDNSIVRTAASKTYTLPQFKEVAPFFYEDVNIASFGNPGLLPAENYNFDLKYEHYFSREELVAVTGFYKKIKNAINRVQVASAANELSYVNTGNADVVGVEVEVRKAILSSTFDKNNTSLTIGLNGSYLYSKQELKDVPTDELTFQPNDTHSALEGASPMLLTTDITFQKATVRGTNITSSVILNYFSDRIFSIGAPYGNQHIYENGVPTLNWISKYEISSRLSIGLNIKNILNPTYLLTKEVDSGRDETISSYKKGITSSVGISYKF